MRARDPQAVAFDRDHWNKRAAAVRERVAVSDVVGSKVALKKRGAEQLGLCPFHNENTPSFTVNDKKGFYHCFGCGEHGDAIGFVMKIGGQDFKDVVELLESQNGLNHFIAAPAPRPRPAIVQADQRQQNDYIERLWKQTIEIRAGSYVDRYLRGRLLVPPALYGFGDMGVNAGWPVDLRYHGDLMHSPTRQGYPAMVAAFRAPGDPVDALPRALHRTYLRASGVAVSKAGTDQDKMWLGPTKGCFIRLSAIASRMAGGEGIETSLSAMQLGRSAGLAFGSTGTMATGVLPFEIDAFTYAADWNAKNRAGEKAAWQGKRLNAMAGRTIVVKVPPLRHEAKADFNDLRQQLAAAAARYQAEAERRSGEAA